MRLTLKGISGTGRYALFVLALTLFYGLCFTMADFYNVPCRGLRDFLIQFLQWGVVEAATLAVLWCLSAHRWMFAVCFPPLTWLCSVVAYFRYTAHITLTPMAIDLALVNDVRTSLDVVTPALILFSLFCLLLSVAAVAVRFRYVRTGRWWLHMAAAAVAFFLLQSVYALARPIYARIPFILFSAVYEYLDDRKTVAATRPEFAGEVSCGADSLDVVFILGETLRAKNMQINGYARPTTPYLCRDSGVVSLPDVWSEYGFTHTSVPYLLTRATPRTPDRAYTERSFFDLFKKAGYRTSWIANQESVNTFVYFMKEADTLVCTNSGKSVYIFDAWLDGDVLPALDAQLKTGDARRMILIHTIGSHWWYNLHYPRTCAKWRPELKSRVLSANTKEEFVNSYDNTVLYSDLVWQQIRDRLRDRKAIVVYLSDHAESLGENGLFGHGEDTDALHRPGCWVWCSDKYRKAYPDKVQALRQNSRRRHNSAFLFHSILSAADIRTPYLDRRYDLFSR